MNILKHIAITFLLSAVLYYFLFLILGIGGELIMGWAMVLPILLIIPVSILSIALMRWSRGSQQVPMLVLDLSAAFLIIILSYIVLIVAQF